MYQPYPGGSQTPDSPQPARPAPVSVARASQVMYVGAVASLVGIGVSLLQRHAIRTDLLKHNHKLTVAQLNDTYHVVLGGLVVGGLIAVGLWIWMALMCKAGKAWARVVSTVLFAVQTIDLAIGAAVPGGGGASRFYGLLVWVIGLVAIILLWQRPSTEYFRGAPRY